MRSGPQPIVGGARFDRRVADGWLTVDGALRPGDPTTAVRRQRYGAGGRPAWPALWGLEKAP